MKTTMMNIKNSPFLLSHKMKSTRFYPWLVISFASLFLFYKYVLQISPSVMTSELMLTFHLDGAGLGNLAAMYFYSYLFAQLFAGPLYDKFSPRTLTAGAILIGATGALLFAHAHTLGGAQFARALIGVGAAFATVGYMKLASIWFKPHQFAFVGGLLATASMVGSMAAQVPLALLVSHVGWRGSLYDCSLLGVVLAVLFFVCVKNKKVVVEKGEENKTSLSWQDFWQVLRNKRNWFLMLYSGLAFSPLAVFGGLWGDPFLEVSHHLTKPAAASLVSLMFLGLALGGPLLGLLSDRLRKRFEIMLVGLVLSVVTLLPVIYVPVLPVWLVGVLLFLFGFGTGAFMLGFTVGKEINSVMLAGSVVALINTGDAVFGAFTEPLVGKLLDVFWNGHVLKGVHQFGMHDYHLALVMLPLYLLAALLFLLLLGNKKQVSQG